jgi:hypothetical protein
LSALEVRGTAPLSPWYREGNKPFFVLDTQFLGGTVPISRWYKKIVAEKSSPKAVNDAHSLDYAGVTPCVQDFVSMHSLVFVFI